MKKAMEEERLTERSSRKRTRTRRKRGRRDQINGYILMVPIKLQLSGSIPRFLPSWFLLYVSHVSRWPQIHSFFFLSPLLDDNISNDVFVVPIWWELRGETSYHRDTFLLSFNSVSCYPSPLFYIRRYFLSNSISLLPIFINFLPMSFPFLVSKLSHQVSLISALHRGILHSHFYFLILSLLYHFTMVVVYHFP